VVTQWVPLYETSLEAVKSEIATFLEVFPGGTIWSNDIAGAGYDIVLLGQAGETRIDVDQLQRRLDRHDHASVVQSLEEIKLGSALGLLKTYAGQGADLGSWLNGAEINRDRNLRLQYLAGMGLNSYQAEAIFESLLAHRQYPENLFAATGIRGRALKVVLETLPSSQ
jgi:spermidine synthase